jgi:hypothetical protein
MANTITTKTIQQGNYSYIVYVTLVSDGTQETNTVIYNSSTASTALGIKDPKFSKINQFYYSPASSAAKCRLSWDATTPVCALALPSNGCSMYQDFRPFGGLQNTGGTGITGNITITTTGLASGDSLTLLIDVRPQ